MHQVINSWNLSTFQENWAVVRVILHRIMEQFDSAPNSPVEVEKLLTALRSERVRCKAFERTARAALNIASRVERLERLCDRLAADQQALRAEVRRELAPLATVVQEIEDLGASVQQILVSDH